MWVNFIVIYNFNFIYIWIVFWKKILIMYVYFFERFIISINIIFIFVVFFYILIGVVVSGVRGRWLDMVVVVIGFMMWSFLMCSVSVCGCIYSYMNI